MSKPLAAHDLIANDEKESPIKKLPYLNTRTDFLQFDPLEYLLGMERGGLVNDLPGDVLLEVRLNLVREFFKGYWIIVPEYDILQHLLNSMH
ncbi:hypothetical protein DXG01_001401 [Tephrocybe rancida]|nr:hypothetical protein DXG01_001401 [Tephrocybe rancida]